MKITKTHNLNKLYLYVINACRIMFYVVIAGLFDCVISVFAMFLYIYFGKNKNQYELFGIFFSMNKLISYICI